MLGHVVFNNFVTVYVITMGESLFLNKSGVRIARISYSLIADQDPDFVPYLCK